jgi:hypothetical protein
VFMYNDFTYSRVASLPRTKPKAVNRLIGLLNWLADESADYSLASHWLIENQPVGTAGHGAGTTREAGALLCFRFPFGGLQKVQDICKWHYCAQID